MLYATFYGTQLTEQLSQRNLSVTYYWYTQPTHGCSKYSMSQQQFVYLSGSDHPPSAPPPAPPRRCRRPFTPCSQLQPRTACKHECRRKSCYRIFFLHLFTTATVGFISGAHILPPLRPPRSPPPRRRRRFRRSTICSLSCRDTISGLYSLAWPSWRRSTAWCTTSILS